MKKFLLSSLLLMMTSASLAAHLTATLPKENCSQLKQIHCRITPHHRSKPHLKLGEGISSNWSGYVAATSFTKPAKGSVNDVSGCWVVPTLKQTSDNSYSSIWVGIDGYGSSTVEQIGTEHDWVGGVQQNYAWFEMFPQGSYQIVGFPVDTGDSIGAEVTYKGNDTFKLAIYNYTKSVYSIIPSSHTKAHGTSRISAEWIVEAPSSASTVLPLAHFNKVSMTKCQAIINGKTGSISDNHWTGDEIKMAMTNLTVKAEPSSLTNSGKDFAVTWKHE
jgi:hypothetical protein